jgi:hypothetical protein
VWAVRTRTGIVGIVEVGQRTPLVGVEDKLVCKMRLVDEMRHVKIGVALSWVGHFVARPTPDDGDGDAGLMRLWSIRHSGGGEDGSRGERIPKMELGSVSAKGTRHLLSHVRNINSNYGENTLEKVDEQKTTWTKNTIPLPPRGKEIGAQRLISVTSKLRLSRATQVTGPGDKRKVADAQSLSLCVALGEVCS